MHSKIVEVSLLILRGYGVRLYGLCISVEVLGVHQILDLWDPGWRHSPVEHHFEIHAAEPLVGFDFVRAVLAKSGMMKYLREGSQV